MRIRDVWSCTINWAMTGKPRQHTSRRIRGGCLLLPVLAAVLALASCSSRHDRQELPSTEHVQTYGGTWEYRYGDSPRRSDGTLDWADPKNSDAEWQRTKTLRDPKGRGSHNHLWLRTRLVGPQLTDARMLIPAVHLGCEAYLDGQLVDQLGAMDAASAHHNFGVRPLYIPLGENRAGATLAVRVYAPGPSIGLDGVPLIGDRAGLIVASVKVGVWFVIFGGLLLALGIGALGLYALQRSEDAYLLYGIMTLTLGIYMFSRSAMRAFFVEEPMLWRALEVLSLGLTPALVSAFLARILGSGPLGILWWVSRTFIAYLGANALLIAAGLIHLEATLRLLLYLWIPFIAIDVSVVAVHAWRGSSDARLLAGGLLVTAVVALHNVLNSLEILEDHIDTRHYATFLFLAALGLVLARRFRALNKRLADYSTVLQMSFASAHELAPGEHAQLALAELLRMLQAERSLLFLCKPDSSELELVAGRDSNGTVLLDPATQGSHDPKLVEGVLKKRRPLVREFALPTPSLDGRPEQRSALAAPLMARGQLLGVLYLEANLARRTFGREDVEILVGLASQVALTLMTTRAVRLEDESARARKRLEEQGALLDAAARMAGGDLQSPIAIPDSNELAPLGQALDRMRQDLLAKLRQMEATSSAVQKLNLELRQHIDMRLGRLVDAAQRKQLGAMSAAETGRAIALKPGDLVGENYRVVAPLGEGATGSVYEVERTTDGQHLAAKILRGRMDQTVSLRFAREARILARLSHPNIVSIADVDVMASGELLMVIELVRGTPLSRLQDRYGDVAWARQVLLQVATGLDAVHSHGIVHRDLKPGNVLIAESKTETGPALMVKLLDFGVSTLVPTSLATTLDSSGGAPREKSGSLATPGSSGQLSGHFTGAGILVGTPMYLAPELVEGSRKARPPSDIFSFGVIAYELLSGEMPFVEPAVATQARGEPLEIEPLRKHAPNLPARLVALVERCLAADPTKRPTAAEIVEDLHGPSAK